MEQINPLFPNHGRGGLIGTKPALKEEYPDAVKQDDRWVSASLLNEDCDGVSFTSEGTAELYRHVGGGRVYRGWGGRVHLALLFSDLQGQYPETFQRVLEVIKVKAL